MNNIMKKFINKSGLVILMAAMFLSSCEKQITTSPNQSLDPSVVFSTREGIEAAITGIYARLKNNRLYGRDMITHPEALADNGFATNNSGRLVGEAQNQFPTQTANHFTTTVWIQAYAAINQINLALAAIPSLSSPSITQADRDRWNGQLYFLRGLFYFDLVKIYSYIPGAIVAAKNNGGVILSLTGISDAQTALNYKPARAPIDDVYTQIVNDLTTAEGLLTIPTAGSSAVNLANKLAAEALLARVNLYRKNYAQAKTWADALITNAGSRLTNTSNHVAQWRAATSQEVLFQVAFLTAAENVGVNESLQTSFTTLVTPGNQASTGGWGDLVPTLTLLTDLGITLTGGNTTPTPFTNTPATIASRSNDVRNLLFEPGTNGRSAFIKVECTKFLGKNGAINLDNVPVLRIAEAYLIRAEALGTPGSPIYNAAAALADLKTLKTNRIVNYIGSAEEANDNALTGANLLEEIIRQRRIEFAFEGHRFFDLKRLGRDLIKSPHYNNVAFTDDRILPPLPQADLDINPNLKQNSGY
jgi:hypothetical protein